MPEGVWVPRPQLLARLREAGWSFKRHGKRVEIWKKAGTTQRLSVPTQKLVAVPHVRVVLRQAGLLAREIERFLHEADTRTSR